MVHGGRKGCSDTLVIDLSKSTIKQKYTAKNIQTYYKHTQTYTNIQDILNTLRAMRKHIIRSQLFINDDEILEVDSLRRLICVLHTKTAVAKQACSRLKPVSAKSPTV